MTLRLLIFLFLWPLMVHSQSSDFTALLESNEDGEQLIEGYLTPFYLSAGYGLAGGWGNTAASHKVLGIDLTISAGLLRVPESDLFYSTSGLENTVQTNGTEAPTIFGPSGEEFRPEYRFTDPESGETVEFTGPEGIGLAEQLDDLIGINKPLAPVPTLNFGVGLPAGTDLRIRWLPSIKAGEDSDIKFWGLGVQHDIGQYLKLGENAVDLSFFAGITSLRMRTDLRNDVITTENDIISTDGQGIVRLQSLVFRGQVSKDLSVLTFFGALGFTHVSAATEVNGTYSYTSGDEVTTVVDPIDFTFRSGGPSLTAGLRVKLWVFTLHGSYTLQRYNSVEAGFGINVN